MSLIHAVFPFLFSVLFFESLTFNFGDSRNLFQYVLFILFVSGKMGVFYFILFCSSLLYFGCSSGPRVFKPNKKKYAIVSDSVAIRYKTNEKFFSSEEEPPILFWLGKNSPIKKGDTFEIHAIHYDFGFWSKQRTEAYLLYLPIPDENKQGKKDSVWCYAPSVLESYYHDLYKNGMEIKVSESEALRAWGRTYEYIKNNSKLEIIYNGDYVITTKSNTKNDKGTMGSLCGYNARRIPKGDSTVIQIDIKGSCRWGGEGFDELRELRGAHLFIKYGIGGTGTTVP